VIRRAAAATRVSDALVALAAAAVAVVAGVASAPPAEAATTQYYSGVLCDTCSHWHNGWNYYYYNQAYNNSYGGLPWLRVMEHKTDGSWIHTYSAYGSVDVCHVRNYSEPGCSNITGSNYSASVTCYYRTSIC
jgi:hypothetical protein